MIGLGADSSMYYVDRDFNSGLVEEVECAKLLGE